MFHGMSPGNYHGYLLAQYRILELLGGTGVVSSSNSLGGMALLICG